ncbi:hypothetical protein ACFX2I_000260 [Malus domestica]
MGGVQILFGVVSNILLPGRIQKAFAEPRTSASIRQKSVVYFSANTPREVQEELCTILNMSRLDDPRTYLGIPMVWGKAKSATLSYIKDKVLSKIQGWKNKFLSQARREVLIKVVVQAVPTYPMNVFCLLARLCNDIDGAIAKFWWANSSKAP